METTRTTTDLQEAADKAAKGISDPEEMRKASDRMEVLRESLKLRLGTVNIGTESIRELRDT